MVAKDTGKGQVWMRAFYDAGDFPDECVEFPYGKFKKADGSDSYGKVMLLGERHTHRAMARLMGWEIDGLEVRHDCDNPPCVNPRHLRPGTSQDNSDDMVKRGRSTRGKGHGQVKLTDDNVRAIRASTEIQQVVADRYGVSRSLVSLIKLRKKWGHVE